MRNWLHTLTAVMFCLALGLFASASSIRAFASSGEQAPPAQIQSENWPQPAPALVGGPDDWLNTDGHPIQLKRGAVYLIDFWEYTCVNCLRTLPYLKEWNRRYAKDGLVIIGIHTPEFRFAHDRSNVAAAVKRLDIDWPVLVDSNYLNWNAFRNSYWPRHYFIDVHGNIVDDHAGEGGYAESELIIQRLLREARPNLVLPVPMSPLRGEDTPGARCYPMTPEIYAGVRGNQAGQLGNMPEFQAGHIANYTAPAGTLDDGRIYLSGSWRTEEESLQHGRVTTGLTDKILLQYHAIEVNGVIKSETGKPFRVYVTQDHHPVSQADKGEDVRYDPNGESYILVEQPRMYRLIRNAKYGSHLITLASHSPAFALYSFTFTSCEEK